MIINLATIDFGGGGGGGNAKPAVLQEKSIGIQSNGSQTVVPDEGYDGLSSVDINVAITGASSAIDFSPIGYDADLSAELNAVWNNDVAYSKPLYDAWNPSNTSANSLYKSNKKLVYAPNIDTSNVATMSYMFNGCTSLTTVPMYNTSNVIAMGYMFEDCPSLTSVPTFDTSNVTNVYSMFKNCPSLTSVPTFDTSNVTDMGYMFYNCTSLTTVPTYNTSNVTTMNSMFNGCSGLTSVPTFDTSKVTDMNRMFQYCSGLTSVPTYNTSNVTNMNSMFNGCSGLTSVPTFDTSKVTDVYNMFNGCTSLTTIEGISFKSATTTLIFGYSRNSSVRKAVFKDIGTNTAMTKFDVSYATNWGVNSDEILDARQSFIDSLITYSFDRAAAGYSTCTIALSANTKALLTDDEKAQIVAKGYVIS